MWPARKEDRVRSVASGHAILGPGEPAIHLRCPRICRWWICKRPADEGSRGGIGDGPREVALAAVSVSSLPGIPLCHRRLVGPRRVFRSHDCNLSVATPTTLLPREQIQSLRHAPHRLGCSCSQISWGIWCGRGISYTDTYGNGIVIYLLLSLGFYDFRE